MSKNDEWIESLLLQGGGVDRNHPEEESDEVRWQQIDAALSPLSLGNEQYEYLYEKLSDHYCVVSDLSHLRRGSYLRWIHVNQKQDGVSFLNTGGILLDILFFEQQVNLLCKAPIHRLIQVPFNDQVIYFQKRMSR
jgi:hypothetical protein